MTTILDKNTIKAITQALQPEQVEYVADINSILNTIGEKYPEIEEREQSDDVLFILKLLAFSTKFKNLHWSASNMSWHKAINEFYEELDIYIDDVAEQIQSIIGQFDGNEFTSINLPTGDNPLDIINELKMCVNNYFELHEGEIEYEGVRNMTSGFIETIHKYVYLFRLCKISSCDCSCES